MKPSERIILRLFEEERERLHEAWTWGGPEGDSLRLRDIAPRAARTVASRVAFLSSERVTEIARTNHKMRGTYGEKG